MWSVPDYEGFSVGCCLVAKWAAICASFLFFNRQPSLWWCRPCWMGWMVQTVRSSLGWCDWVILVLSPGSSMDGGQPSDALTWGFPRSLWVQHRRLLQSMLNMIRENTRMFAFVRVTWLTLSCQLVKCGAGAKGRLMVHYKGFVRWSDGQIGMGGGEANGCICNFSKKRWPEIHTENAIKVKLSLISFAICLCGSCCLTSIACVSTPDHHHSAVYLYPHVTLRLSDL